MPKKVTQTLSDGQIEDYINGIYEGDITEENLPLDVYESIVKYLKKGLYSGYGMTLEEAEGQDLELLTELRENVYMFSAAKTYQMTKEISSLLIGDDDKPRTLKEFQEVGRSTYDNWNDNYGETEYSTAHGQAYQAVKWKQIEKEKDTLPNLRYSAIGDACDICMPLDGLTAPINDPIWDGASPLNHFNCKCIQIQEPGDVLLTPDDEKEELENHVEENIDKVFWGNPGKTGEIFNKHHPYFDVAKADREFAANNFDLPIPEKD